MRVPLPPQCPPADAKRADGKFLRFARPGLEPGSDTGPDDWLLPYEEPLSPFKGKTEVCDCHAISLLADPADVVVARKVVPAFRKRSVAEVELTPDMGQLKPSPSRVGKSHHSWWPEPIDLVPDAQVIA